jgi:hypothetical protein
MPKNLKNIAHKFLAARAFPSRQASVGAGDE